MDNQLACLFSLYLCRWQETPATDWEIMFQPNWESNARLMAELVIETAAVGAEMGCVLGTSFDALADVYAVFIDYMPGIAHDARVARKQMRETEWGDDLGTVYEWDLELDEEWLAN